MRALVILPTYDEAPNIADVLHRIRAAMPAADILVVDDASPDGTADLAEAVGAEIGRVFVLRRPEKQGIGPAYRAGFRWALERGYEAVVEMDADLSHDPADLPALVGALEDGADFAVGSRYIPGGAIPDWSRLRWAISYFGNLYARLLLRNPVHDMTSGFRAFRCDVLRGVDLGAVHADGYGFQVEMLYRLDRLGAKGVEVPIVFRDRTRGHSKMSFRIVVEALALVTRWGLRDALGALRRRAR